MGTDKDGAFCLYSVFIPNFCLPPGSFQMWTEHSSTAGNRGDSVRWSRLQFKQDQQNTIIAGLSEEGVGMKLQTCL